MKRFLKLLLAILIVISLAETALALGFPGRSPRPQTAPDTASPWQRVRQSVPYSPSAAESAYHTLQNQLNLHRSLPFFRAAADDASKAPGGFVPLNTAEIFDQYLIDPSNIKPEATSFYPAHAPASNRPVLTWTVVPGAVYYELELLAKPPENPNGTELSEHRLAVSREIFTHGYNADLRICPDTRLYWRVRALDYDGGPLGVFSDAQEIYIDHTKTVIPRPVVAVTFNENGAPTPLFPAYSWIPVAGAASYELEVLDAPPESPDSAEPSRHRIWSKQVPGSDCYDEEPRNIPGTYYWRVLGLDGDGRAVGVYSEPCRFIVDDHPEIYAATFGDSITHGGGAVSYSPGNPEYSYQTYLKFPVMNLGRSGDTTQTMLERFDRDVLPYRPRHLIILGGTNSLRGGTPADKVISELAAIRDKCLAAGIRPIFLTLPPINPAAIQKVFEEETVPNWRGEFDTVNSFIRRQHHHIDIEPFLTDANRELPLYYAIDGLHPDIEGKRLLAHIININWDKVTR